GKGAGIVLDENAEESFHRAPQSTVDHERLMPAAIFADVFEPKAPGEIEVKLHGGELPGTADRVDQLDVDLRAIKCGFAFHAFEGNLHALQSRGESARGAFPILA